MRGSFQGLTGTLPTELGTLTALTYAYVRRPHPPCLDACAVTGLWTERGVGLGVQDAKNTGTFPTELGTLTACAMLCVRRPHPPLPGRVRRYRVMG
jgi:hypothetical protein